jgi:two-component system sensor histidine kinase KdpD
VLGASRRTRWQEITRGSLLARVLRQAGAIDVHVIHDDTEPGGARRPRRWPSQLPSVLRPDVGGRRLGWAWILTVAGLPSVVAGVLPLREHTAISTVLLLVLTAVLAIAAIGGTLVGVVAAVVASLLVNWFFVPPYNTLTIADVENAIALAVFVGVAVTVGSLVVAASRRSVEAQRARLEARALASAATTLAADPDPLPELLAQVRATFGLQGVAIAGVGQAGDVSGEPSVQIALEAAVAGRLGSTLDIYGHRLGHDDLELVELLADQLTVAIDKRRLASEAAEAEKLADIDAVRTALLRAVSHDLRTPLASIKAMVSGLRDEAVAWRPEEVAEAHATIEEETDRLTRLVANLLDASRLEIGALAVELRPTSLDTVVGAVVRSIDAEPGALAVSPIDPAASVLADAALLERSLDNVVRNALRFSPAGRAVTVAVGSVGAEQHIRVVDHGPGVAAHNRGKVLRPFQRLGDEGSADGVGLGLSIARGFVVDAMHGTFALDDTPGGGLTVTIGLPGAGVDGDVDDGR